MQSPEIESILKILGFATASFLIAIIWTPALTKFLVKIKAGKQIRDSGDTPIFSNLHQKKVGTPTMGGILIWGTVLFIILISAAMAYLFPQYFEKLNFLSRSQTVLPLGILIFSALVGLFDDLFGIWRIGPNGGGLRMRHRIILYTLIAIVGAGWFYFKLDWDVFHIPFLGDFRIGFWYVPIFIFVIVATAFSVNETDGLDGLAGGTMLIAFLSYIVVAINNGKYDLAVFNAAIVGSLLAFLWFNIYPAKFFMGDTGAMALGVTLGVMAMLTNSALLLPLFGSIFVLESLSVIVQVISKKWRGKKIFLSTPIHHHFEALGWPETKVTMRFWIVAGVFAMLGLIIALIDRRFF